MNRSEKRRNPLRKFVLVAALLYGVSLGWFVVPSVVGSVVPEAAWAIRHSASQMRPSELGVSQRSGVPSLGQNPDTRCQIVERFSVTFC